MDNIKLDEMYQSKLDEKAYSHILHCILNSGGTSYDHLSVTTNSYFISYVVLH